MYVDGFNMYYALNGNRSHSPYRQYKWLNYRALAERLVGTRGDVLDVVYFTALTKWKPASVARHKAYIKALRTARIETVQGHFKKKDMKCHLCRKSFKTHEEKRTDVNIALRVVADAAEDRFDRAIILSADSDLIPVIRTVHQLAPEKEVGVLIPIGRVSRELDEAADFRFKMKERHLRQSIFPDRIATKTDTIVKPESWPSPIPDAGTSA